MKLAAIKRLRQAAGTVVAPLAFMAGRALGSDRMMANAEALDPLNFRTTLYRHGSAHPEIAQLLQAAALTAYASPANRTQVRDHVPAARGQLLQDMFALVATDFRRNGSFVEVGVGDGEYLSNTFLLEKHFGWQGLLIEPNASSHAAIRQCRSAPLDVRAAASASGVELIFEEVIGEGELSRLAGKDGHAVADDQIRQYPVTTVRLDEALSQANMPKLIDFLSLDTEGAELDILAGLDLNVFTFSVMAIEHNYRPGVLDQLYQILAPDGYRQVLTQLSAFDVRFVHSDMANMFSPR
jgi:FkbM family methyltransferase